MGEKEERILVRQHHTRYDDIMKITLYITLCLNMQSVWNILHNITYYMHKAQFSEIFHKPQVEC